MSQKEINTAIVQLIRSAETLINNQIDPVYIVTDIFRERVTTKERKDNGTNSN